MAKKQVQRHVKKYPFRSIIPSGSCHNCSHCTAVYCRCVQCHHPLCKSCVDAGGNVCVWCKKAVQ